MSQVAATQIPKPTDEQAFERQCVILFRGILNDPNVQTNGRRGQRQNGVDIFGFRNQDAAHPVGAQCKLKGADTVLTEREVRDEVKKALTFVPPLREYFIVTTGPDDTGLQRLARELTTDAASNGRQISINVWGWHTLEQRINEHGPAMRAFDPTYGVFAQQQIEQLGEIVDQQSVLIREVGHVRREVSLSIENLPGGRTVGQNDLEAAFDAEIDRYRDILNNGKPKTALEAYNALLDRVKNSASGRILFRIKANIGHCHFMLGDNVRAAHWLQEAVAHASTEPKAIANKALSMLLQEKFKEAYEYGIIELQNDPSNQWLAGYVVQAIARCPEVDDPLSKIPESLRDLESVQVTYVDFLRFRNRIPDWWDASKKASAAHPDNKVLFQYTAEAELDEIGRNEELERGLRLPSEIRNKIEEAAKILLERWDTRRSSENPDRPDGVSACCNLLAAYSVLGENASALSIAKQAISLVPDDDQLTERAAIAALEGNDYAFAESLLSKLPQTPNGLLVQFQYYAHTNNWPKLIEIAKQADAAAEPERPLIGAMGRLARLIVDTKTKQQQKDELTDILSTSIEDVRAYVVIADFASRLGFHDIGDKAYERAVAKAEQETKLIGRYMLTRTASRRADWRTVIQLLDNQIDTNTHSEELHLLAAAFVNETPTRKRAVEFFSEIGPAVRNLPLYLTAHGLLQSKRGDLAAAEESFELALTAEPENLTALRNLFSVYLRQERSDRNSLFKSRIENLDLKKLKGPAIERMALTHILRDIGEGKRALEWAYEIVQSDRNNPKVALAYFGLIIAQSDRIEIPSANEVGVDTWVSIKNNLGETRSLLIEEGADRPADGVYSPSHSFVAPALGLKVGQSFTQQRHVGRPETWTILEIKHKYLHALHDIMDTFNVRFPEESGFYRVTTRDGDFSPILDEVKTHSERSQSIVDLYSDKKVPLAFVAAMTKTEVIKFASGVTQFGKEIIACYGNDVERATAERLVRDFVGKGATLDCYTVWTAEGIGILPTLKELFGTIFIPRSAIDEIAAIQHEHGDGFAPTMTVSYRNGQFFREELSPEELAKRANALAERRQRIEQYCTVVPVDVPETATDLARGLIEQFDSRVLDSAFLAVERDSLLVCDELYFRQIAQQVCDAKGAFLQAAITVADSKGLLDRNGLASAIVGLAALRHSHVALTPVILFEVAQEDKTDNLIKFRTVTEYIGTKSAEINSHIRVTISFLTHIWRLEMPDLVKQALSGIILEQLLRFRTKDSPEIITILRSGLSQNRRASRYLETWIKGHFLGL